MDYLFGTTTTSTADRAAASSSSSSRLPLQASDAAALDAAADDAAGMEQRRLMMALHSERERLAAEQLAIDAKWESAEAEKKRLQEHLMSTSRTLEDTRTQLADQERFLRAQHAAEARRRKDLLNRIEEVKLNDVDAGKQDELLHMAQSVDAARARRRGAEREADDIHGEANEARRRAFEIQRQLDDSEAERWRAAADARRQRAATEVRVPCAGCHAWAREGAGDCRAFCSFTPSMSTRGGKGRERGGPSLPRPRALRFMRAWPLVCFTRTFCFFFLLSFRVTSLVGRGS